MSNEEQPHLPARLQDVADIIRDAQPKTTWYAHVITRGAYTCVALGEFRTTEVTDDVQSLFSRFAFLAGATQTTHDGVQLTATFPAPGTRMIGYPAARLDRKDARFRSFFQNDDRLREVPTGEFRAVLSRKMETEKA